jgi:2-pyrone-4,6-dicarboxylate lactonase
MSVAKEKFPDWVRDTRLPDPPPPPLSCDCQFHVYDDVEKYPPKWQISHELPRANFAEAREMLRRLGFGRGVFVHASVYDTDYRLLFDSLGDPSVRQNFRGVVVIKDDTTDTMLQRLDDVGVRGVRFHIAKRYQPYPKDALLRTLSRIGELGWHARLHFDPPELLEYADVLAKVKTVPIVVDHMGRLDFALGLAQPAFRWIMDRLTHDDWWMMVSNGNRMSAQDSGWDDAVPYGRAYIEAAPDRTIWATDWPHVRWRKQRMMNDAEEVELLYRYVDHDKALLQKILVDNPARLHGFPD